MRNRFWLCAVSLLRFGCGLSTSVWANDTVAPTIRAMDNHRQRVFSVDWEQIADIQAYPRRNVHLRIGEGFYPWRSDKLGDRTIVAFMYKYNSPAQSQFATALT